MHCRRPKGAHRRALCLAMRARPAGSNSAHLIWQDRLLFARRGPRRAAALMMSVAMLSGCSLASSVGSSDSSPSFASRFASFFSGAKPGVTQPHSPTPSPPEVECPGVDIRTGASTMNIAAKTTDATAGDLRYQLSFGQTARECAVQGATMIIKVGVQGRVILDRWAVHLAAKRSHFHVHPGSHLWMCARAGRRRGIKHGISQHA
jgi:hypothetical protein